MAAIDPPLTATAAACVPPGSTTRRDRITRSCTAVTAAEVCVRTATSLSLCGGRQRVRVAPRYARTLSVLAESAGAGDARTRRGERGPSLCFHDGNRRVLDMETYGPVSPLEAA